MADAPSRSRIPFVRSLLGRMLLYGVLPSVVVLLAVIAVNGRRAFDLLERSAEVEIEDAARVIATQVEEENRRAVQVSKMVAIAQLNGLFGDRRRTLDFHRDLLLAHPELYAVTVCYEPNADGKDADPDNADLPTVLGPDGRFIPYTVRDASEAEGFRYEPLVGQDDPETLWYQGTKKEWERTGKIEPFLTRPYLYQGEQLVEQMVPLVKDGVFLGIAGCDRSLRSIQELIAAASVERGVEVYLVARGTFAAATVDRTRGEAQSLRTAPVASSPLAPVFAARPGSIDDPRFIRAVNPLDGQDSFMATVRIPTGEWTLLVTKPASVVLAPAHRSLTLNFVTAGVGISVVTGLLVFFARGVSRRLQLAVEASARIAEGDLSRDPPEARCGDETGELLRAFRTMGDQLNRLVGQVRHSSIQINSTATELAATSRQQDEVVHSFGSSTSEIAAAVRQITATGDELLGTMRQVGERAGKSSTLAEESRSDLSAMEASMVRLDTASATVSARLGAINEKASAITAVVTTINQVADQTNLLSVNAAIEAEKAGEFGLGFLVVAREIRRLADQTAAATLDIERMVKQMQSAVAGGVMEMDRFAETVRAGVAEVSKVSGRLSEIIAQVGVNAHAFGSVEEGMRSQAAGARQIDEAMRALTSGARQTIAATAEFGKAAEDLQSAMGSLKTSIASFRLRS